MRASQPLSCFAVESTSHTLSFALFIKIMIVLPQKLSCVVFWLLLLLLLPLRYLWWHGHITAIVSKAVRAKVPVIATPSDGLTFVAGDAFGEMEHLEGRSGATAGQPHPCSLASVRHAPLGPVSLTPGRHTHD